MNYRKQRRIKMQPHSKIKTKFIKKHSLTIENKIMENVSLENICENINSLPEVEDKVTTTENKEIVDMINKGTQELIDQSKNKK